MHISSFMMTKEQVRAALQEYYDKDGPAELLALFRRLIV